MLNKCLLIRKGLDTAEFPARVDCLVCPDLEAESCTSKASVVSECGDSAPALILKEFQIEEGSPSAGEAAEDSLPAALVLEDMQEGDVCVLEGEVLIGELFEPEDDVVGWGTDPGAFWDEGDPDTVGVRAAVSMRSWACVCWGGGGSNWRLTLYIPRRRRSSACCALLGHRSPRSG